MDGIAQRVGADDFEGVFEALRQSDERVGREKYYHQVTDLTDVRDVRREWRVGRFAPGQRTYRGVELIWTNSQVGGPRPWFRCPSCGGRSALLFDQACRRCQGIRYRSQYDSRLDRLCAKAVAIRRQLKSFDPEPFGIVPLRASRMRQRTYVRLLAELEAVEVEAAEIVAEEIPGFAETVERAFATARGIGALRQRFRSLW